MKLGFIILAHDHPANVSRLAQRLLSQEATIALHWDKRNKLDLAAHIRKEAGPKLSTRIHEPRRVSVHWGKWSVVQATLNALDAMLSSGLSFDYITLLSGHDYPLRPLNQMRRYLEQSPTTEYIECVPHHTKKWATSGLHDERWQYRHYVSWRTHKRAFEIIWKLQRALGLKRRLPFGITPHFGSQWWTLTGSTASAILSLSRRSDIATFFRRAWVPDELFFQSLVPLHVQPNNIADFSLTFSHFAKQTGVPLCFYNDHFTFLRDQPHFFARKLSPRAAILRSKLDALADQRLQEHPPLSPLLKQLEQYSVFESVQDQGLANRRTIGRQRFPKLGAMEYNQRPYTVIFTDNRTEIQPLLKPFADKPSHQCYGELFHPTHIDYLVDSVSHPLYPPQATKLRDQSVSTFLFDLISYKPTRRAVFVVRLPCPSHLIHLFSHDPYAMIILAVSGPDSMASGNGSSELSLEQARLDLSVDHLIRSTHKNGKTPFCTNASYGPDPMSAFCR
jgi:hypothetical protein